MIWTPQENLIRQPRATGPGLAFPRQRSEPRPPAAFVERLQKRWPTAGVVYVENIGCIRGRNGFVIFEYAKASAGDPRAVCVDGLPVRIYVVLEWDDENNRPLCLDGDERVWNHLLYADRKARGVSGEEREEEEHKALHEEPVNKVVRQSASDTDAVAHDLAPLVRRHAAEFSTGVERKKRQKGLADKAGGVFDMTPNGGGPRH